MATSFRQSAARNLRCGVAVMIFCLLGSHSHADEDRKSIRDEIGTKYPHLDRLDRGKYGYPQGILPLVSTAVQMGIFHEDQKLEDAISVFGKDLSVQRDWMIARLDGARWLLIPLEVHDFKIKEPHTVGVQWHLALRVGNDLTVAGIRLEYCSPKTLTMKEVKIENYEGSKLTRQKAQPQTKKRMPGGAP